MSDNTTGNNTSSDADNELRSIISSLDEFVPCDGAWVKLTQYGGGPDEGQVIGNRNGYRRLGIELLKASLNDDAEQGFTIDLEYLISPDSTINFDWFELSDTPTRTSPTRTWSNRIVAAGCLAVVGLALVIFVIGIGTLVQWIRK